MTDFIGSSNRPTSNSWKIKSAFRKPTTKFFISVPELCLKLMQLSCAISWWKSVMGRRVGIILPCYTKGRITYETALS